MFFRSPEISGLALDARCQEVSVGIPGSEFQIQTDMIACFGKKAFLKGISRGAPMMAAPQMSAGPHRKA